MGKIERMHRTMKTEFLQGRRFLGFEAAQTGSTPGAGTTITSARTTPATGVSRAAATG